MNSLIALAAAALYTDVSLTRGDDEEEDDLDDDSDAGGEEETEAVVSKPTKSASKKKVKKGGKKVSKKDSSAKPKAKAEKSDKNVVRLKDLAKQAKLTEAVCRKKLRDAEVPRGEGRWSWELGSKALKQARKALDLT
jgi:hypothetical protein